MTLANNRLVQFGYLSYHFGFHELPFLPANILRTKVRKFYIVFDVKFSFSKKKIGDRYGIGWLPWAGYVKIGGDDGELTPTMTRTQLGSSIARAWQTSYIMTGGY